MTIDERKMAIAYADLLNVSELFQHILRMDADDLFDTKTRADFIQATMNVDNVIGSVGRWMNDHTEFNEEGLQPDQKVV